MEKEWVDVANNVVKIGLPSLITGFVTIFGMKYSAKSVQNKFMLEHKVKLLEKLSDDIHSNFNAWSMLGSKYGAITKKMDHDSEDISFSKSQLEAIKSRDKELVDTWVSRRSAKGKLRLLKATDSVKKLQNFIDLEVEFRNRIIFDKDYPNYNEFSDIRKNAGKAVKEFDKELANFYESIAS